MKKNKAPILLLTILIILGNFSTLAAQSRIVVLPFYAKDKEILGDSGQAVHYRRIARFINNQLVRQGFEVINPFALQAKEQDYNQLIQRARKDSPLASKGMCSKYGSDAVYFLRLNLSIERTPDGYCKASCRLDGEGYDSGGRDLGVGISKVLKVTRSNCAEAIAEVEKEAGHTAGRSLIARQGSGILENNINEFKELINLRLDGVTNYELSEIFGKVVNTVTGVLKADRYRSRIVPGNPQASYVTWRVRIKNTDPFRLQANITKMIHDILDSPQGEIYLKGVPYRYSAAELDLLKGFRPGEASSREIEFVIDRELSRDREMTRRHDPYQAHSNP